MVWQIRPHRVPSDRLADLSASTNKIANLFIRGKLVVFHIRAVNWNETEKRWKLLYEITDADPKSSGGLYERDELKLKLPPRTSVEGRLRV